MVIRHIFAHARSMQHSFSAWRSQHALHATKLQRYVQQPRPHLQASAKLKLFSRMMDIQSRYPEKGLYSAGDSSLHSTASPCKPCRHTRACSRIDTVQHSQGALDAEPEGPKLMCIMVTMHYPITVITCSGREWIECSCHDQGDTDPIASMPACMVAC